MGDDIDWGASNERLRHQHEEYARRLRNGQCVQCGSTFLGGEEPHRLTVTDELGTRVELRCGDCIEAYSRRVGTMKSGSVHGENTTPPTAGKIGQLTRRRLRHLF